MNTLGLRDTLEAISLTLTNADKNFIVESFTLNLMNGRYSPQQFIIDLTGRFSAFSEEERHLLRAWSEINDQVSKDFSAELIAHYRAEFPSIDPAYQICNFIIYQFFRKNDLRYSLSDPFDALEYTLGHQLTA